MLFTFKDINKSNEPVADESFLHHSNSSNRALVASPGQALVDVVGEIKKDLTCWIFSKGRWSSHQFIEYILNQIGPAEVTLTSWGISEDPLRQILKMREHGSIINLQCLLADRVRTECPKAYQLLKGSGVTFRLTKIHAKIILIRNNDWFLTIYTSANLNRNNKIETYVLSENKALTLKNWDVISKEIAS